MYCFGHGYGQSSEGGEREVRVCCERDGREMSEREKGEADG